jgi:arylsulfatase A-like enzyme
MQSLEDLKLDKNTVIIYLSDNGYMWGEHGLGGKWLLYEESIRVPVIIDIPGIPRRMKGKRADNMVLNIDIAPTILEMAGIPIPAEIDGMSQLPFLLGKEAPIRKDFFMEHVGIIEVETPIPDSRGVRTDEWKYIRYVNIEPEVEEMYRVSQDPQESKNLAENPEYQEIKRQLQGRYDSYLNRFSK